MIAEPPWWLHFKGMTFRSLRERPPSCRRYTSSRVGRRIHNRKLFSKNSLKRDQEPTLPSGVGWNKQYISFDSPELFLSDPQGLRSPRYSALGCWRPRLKFGQVSLCRGLEGVVLPKVFQVLTNTFPLTPKTISWSSQSKRCLRLYPRTSHQIRLYVSQFGKWF